MYSRQAQETFRLPLIKTDGSRSSAIHRLTTLMLVSTLLLSGCRSNKATVCDLDYCDDIDGIHHYRGYESRIEYPCIDTKTTEAVAVSQAPHNILSRSNDVPREISLDEAIQTALSHNEVIESSALGGIGAKTVLTSPDAVSSVYDPGIQRSSVLFGRGRGVEAALADFDTTFSTSMLWGRSLASTGNSPPSPRETGVFRSALQKQFAYGASVSLNHDWNYTGDSGVSGMAGPSGPFPTAYTGNIGAQYRHPFLAGSGTDFTRISGPTNPAFGAITGVGQGVLIARISSDISIADFEAAVRNGIRDIEEAYWDLYLAYRTYDTAVVAHQSAFQTWRESQDRLEVGVLKPADELQARDRLYETKADVENSLSQLYKSESELRRLVGLPMNDGSVLRPIDEPVLAELIPDWDASLTEGLTHRVELRRQKWSIKSTQLQLQAARSLVRPRLDFVGSYDVNGYGDKLLGHSRRQFRSGYGSMFRDDLESWTAGFEFSVPIGLRQARSQVRNIELQLAKSMAVLASQEKNIAHDIATAIQDVTASYSAAQSNHKRLSAASRRVSLLEAERDVGTLTLDLVLRAQASLAAAQSSYYQQLVEYSKALTRLHFATGRLLRHRGIHLAEGPWCQEAYCDAELRAHRRTHGKDKPNLTSEPHQFVSPGPAGTIDLHRPVEKVLEPEATDLVFPTSMKKDLESDSKSADESTNTPPIVPISRSETLIEVDDVALPFYNGSNVPSPSKTADFPSLNNE